MRHSECTRTRRRGFPAMSPATTARCCSPSSTDLYAYPEKSPHSLGILTGPAIRSTSLSVRLRYRTRSAIDITSIPRDRRASRARRAWPSATCPHSPLRTAPRPAPSRPWCEVDRSLGVTGAFRTPPGLYLSGKMCPGRFRSFGLCQRVDECLHRGRAVGRRDSRCRPGPARPRSP